MLIIVIVLNLERIRLNLKISQNIANIEHQKNIS